MKLHMNINQQFTVYMQSARMELWKYSMIIYFFLNDECTIVNCIGGRLSLLDMNWIVCTKLTQLEIAFRDILILLTTTGVETSVVFL